MIRILGKSVQGRAPFIRRVGIVDEGFVWEFVQNEAREVIFAYDHHSL